MLSRFTRSIQSCPVRSRTLATKSGLSEDRTKKVVEEIKRLQYRIESKQKQTSKPFEKLNDQEIASIYKELAAPVPVRPKISPDYLENLRFRFLDTRPQLEDPSASVSDHALTNPAQKDLSVQDFEQLIYTNALAKRPQEAQQAFDLIETYQMTPTTRAVNHLMDAYANAHQLDHVIATFKRLDALGLEADMYTYATLIKAFVGHQRLDDAFILFDKMKEMSLIPSQPIFTSLISGCLKSNQLDRAWELFDAMRLSFHQPDEVSFTLMLHACAKRGEVERALNLFEDMTGHHLFPTDVTFNVLINACAKRPDYFDEAFSLLDQMQSTYGFLPDKITFNTLLMACARKRDLTQAKRILRFMHQTQLEPDHHTYTNLFWCYASYQPIRQQKLKQATSDALTVQQQQEVDLPQTRAQLIHQAHMLFQQIPESVQRTSGLMNAYLAIHVSHQQTAAEQVYQVFDQLKLERDGHTFAQMLDYCYKRKEERLAWKVWEDYQDFLEKRQQQQATTTMSEQKAQTHQRHQLAQKEGWTEQHQLQLAIRMSNTLGRCDAIDRAMDLLTTESRRIGLTPRLREMMPLYNKCIQLEQDRSFLIQFCLKEPYKKNKTYRRIYT